MSRSTQAMAGLERGARRWRAAAWVGLLVTASVPTGPTGPAGAVEATESAASMCLRIGIPAYARPGAMWDQVGAGAPTVRYAIFNPASGPGTERDHEYEVTVSRTQRRGVEVLGYVDTDYGRRSSDDVRAEIDRYEQWYGLDGIFLDRVTGTRADSGYYLELAAHVRSDLGMTLAVNPGSHPDEVYAWLADVVVTFEGDADAYLALESPAWVEYYPPDHFWHLVHSSSEAQLQQVLELARSRRAGTIYVTDRGLDNPWDVAASYWETERDAVAQTAAGCAARRPR